jgi:hypothetical protein
MSASQQRWSLLDQATAVHRIGCEALAGPAVEQGLEVDAEHTEEAVMRYGLAARSIYSDLRRLVGQLGGLLILAQASKRRDVLDLPSLSHAEDLSRDVAERMGRLHAPGRLGPHRDRLAEAARLASHCLGALRDLRADAKGEPELDEAGQGLARAYRLLQSTSDSRFGMMMVDFRHACCSCGALR